MGENLNKRANKKDCRLSGSPCGIGCHSEEGTLLLDNNGLIDGFLGGVHIGYRR